MIQPATMKVDDRQVYVVSGDVVMFEDGTGVDARGSSDEIIVMDKESGKLEFTTADKISRVDEAVDPQVELDAAMAEVDAERQRVADMTQPEVNDGGMMLDNEENSVTSHVNDIDNGNRSEQGDDESAVASGDDGSTMVGDAASGLAADRDRGDIRVYEEGLAASYDEYSEYSERDRREAESERLVEIARGQGQYIPVAGHVQFGEKNSRRSGESEVYVDKDAGRVYKVKNPYAKSPMKGGVQPEDAILEHHLHNRYFPETAYRFEGISDDAGDVRIVLSQDYVESVGQPTKAQIEAALAEKGLYPEGKYTYGNEEVSVTDVTGDNALLGVDGKVYFIDPIINVKKPVREILGDAGKENTVDGTVSEVSEKSVASTGTVGDDKQTPLERLPRDEKGNPVFEQAESAEHGWDALVEYSDGDVDAAKEVADVMVEEKRKALAKAQTLKTKGRTPAEILASRKANAAEVTKAQAEFEYWQKVAAVEQGRQDALHAQERAEAEEAARAEQQWQEDKRKLDKRLRETAEEVRDVPEAVAVLENMDPQSIDEVAAYVLSTNRVLWGAKKRGGAVVSQGAAGHTGFGEGERRKLFGLFASEEKGGVSIERLAEDVFEEACQMFKVNYDNLEARDALIDMISGAHTMGDIRNYIADRRMEQARKIAEDYREYYAQADEDYHQENYHMGAREYRDYEEQMMELLKDCAQDFDERDFYSNIADEIINRQRKEDEYRRVHGTAGAGADARDGGGDEVLPSQRTVERGRGETVAEQGAGRGAGDRVAQRDTAGEVPAGARGERELDNDRIARRRESIKAVLGEKYALSDEMANNGEVFYRNADGSTELAHIDEGIFDRIGLNPVPFKLTETMGWHVYNNHAKELGLKNMDDAIDFILDIINNVDHVRLGRDNSYIFSIENGRGRVGRRAVTIVINSETGEFMGIRTSGYDRIKNLEERPMLWQRGADSAAEAVATPTVTTIKAQQGDEHMGRTEGQSKGARRDIISGSKDNTLLSDKQASASESSVQQSDNVAMPEEVMDYADRLIGWDEPGPKENPFLKVGAEKPDVQITDEMEDIAKQMRDILGVDDSEVSGVHFRDPDELKPEQKRKLVMLGIDLTMRLFDQGKTDFPTVAKVMVGMVGEKIKPWIKAMYKNATIVPGYEEMPFTSDEEIDRFDMANFDKPGADVIRQAEMVLAERKATQATSQVEKEVIETRNQKRKEHDRQRSENPKFPDAGDKEAVSDWLFANVTVINDGINEMSDAAIADERMLNVFRNGDQEVQEIDTYEFTDKWMAGNHEGHIELAKAYYDYGQRDLIASIIAGRVEDKLVSDAKADKADGSVNGYRRGEKVWYTRNDGKGKRELATIVDFGGSSDVTLDTGMAPVMYEACTWSQIEKREPDIFDEAAEVAEAAKAKREHRNQEVVLDDADIDSSELPVAVKERAKRALRGSASMTDNFALIEVKKSLRKKNQSGERPVPAEMHEEHRKSGKNSVSSQKKQPEVKPEQPIGDLFSGLSDEKTIKNQDYGKGRDENGRADNRGSEPEREGFPASEQVGAGASVQYASADSKGERRGHRVGRGESGTRPEYDVEKDYSNEEIHAIASSVATVKDGKVVITGEVTDDIKAICRQYKSGGVAKKGRGVLDEYYTDGKIVEAVRMLIAPYFEGKTARVLEPSVGIGNFADAWRDIHTSEVVAFEINETTARIAKILHPEMDVNLRSFETEFIDDSGNRKPLPAKYTLIAGNPPYGSHRGFYKGLGEESRISRYEDYFVKRSLDVLDEGGVLAMVLPSSWIDRHTRYGGYRIEDAYRLPSGAFESTQVGTDIVVLRKDSSVPESEHVPYFEQHPEKICGEVRERKGRFGKPEKYVEGSIDAAIGRIERENAKRLAEKTGVALTADNLNEIQSAIEETGDAGKAIGIVKEAKSPETGNRTVAAAPAKTDNRDGRYKVVLGKEAEVVPTSAQFRHTFSEGEVDAFEDTDYDGTLYNPSKHGRYANYIGGKAVHDFYYAEGDIYSKLEQLERDREGIVGRYGEEQYEKQKRLLESVLPKRKEIGEITISPNTTFVKNLRIRKPEGDMTLRDMFIDFCRKLPYQAFGSSSSWEVTGYVNNEQVYGQDKQRNQLVRERRKRVANDLFVKFLNEELTASERSQVVHAFNREYNSTYRPDYSKVPMFSKINRVFKGRPLKLTSVQLAGVGRMTVKGVGVLAHEVGFGKTLSGVLAMHEAMTRGFAKKPLIVVPNDNILKQWVETIGEVLPKATVNVLGNLGAKYDLTGFRVNDHEYTIVTYEGLKAMSFSDDTYGMLADRFSYITEDLDKHRSERDMQKEMEKRKELQGKMRRGTKPTYGFEDFGFDYLTFDEVHNANHIVSKVRLDKSVASDFRSQSQRTSDLGIKTWLAAQYIQEQNNGRNVLLLSATPFTNKPLEYYSILSLVGNDMLRRKGFFNVDQFFSTFMEADNGLEIGANGRPVQKTNVRKFRNNGLFQQLLSEFIDIKGEEDNPDLERPERHNREYRLRQNDLTAEAIAAAQGMLSDNETVLQGIGHARAAAFSPYATSLLGMRPKDHREFVENSPKIEATVRMIERNKKDCPDAGQIIYSEVGVEFFPLIRDYLVKESGFKPGEVRIITGATSNAERVSVQTAFNKGEVKVVIGSPAIKEGLNLQENTTDMYILSLPWNFTQLRQIEGRGWRQGNRWKNIRINYMLTDDSVDVFMLQRLQTKQGLYNEAMKRGAESVDVSDIDTAELKTALITDPAVRAQIVTMQERAKLDQEKTQVEADLAFVMRKYKAYNDLLEEAERERSLMKSYREYAKNGGYWAMAVKDAEKRLAATAQKVEQEKQRLLEKGVNVDDIVRQTEESQKAIEAIEDRIGHLKEFEEELAEKYRREDENKEVGENLSSYLDARAKENRGGFYSLRPKKSDEVSRGVASGDGDVRLRGGEHDGGMVSEVSEISEKSNEEASGVAEMSGDETDVEAMRGKAEELAGRLNLPVRIVTTAEEAGGLPTVSQRNSKGFYDEGADRRGETAITVVLPNHRNLADVVRTILHEGVWHKGIRLFCKSDAELHNLLDHLYDNSSDGIRAEIDAEADAMYRRTLDGLKRRYGNGAIGEARAVAETERMKREGKFRRDATEEFGARVTEEVKDGEFERMSEDRLGFFGRIVSFVEKAIEKILRGVKIRMPRRYTRGDWKMFSHLFYERLRRGETPAEFKARTGKEWNPVYAEAERVSVRYKEERDGDKKKPTWNETCSALTEMGMKKTNGKTDAHSDSLSHAEAPRYLSYHSEEKPNGKTVAVSDSRSHAEASRYVPSHSEEKTNGKTVAVSDWPSRAVAPGYVPSHSDAAKVKKIVENLKSIYEKVADTPLGANEMVFEVSKALGIPSATSGQSNYVELKIGESELATTIRVSNHSAKVRNFGRTTNNVGIVIKAGNNRFQSDSGHDYVEFVYYGDKVEGDAGRQRAIIDGLRHYIETGSFERMPEADRLNTSGRYRDAIDGLEDAIYFRDGGLGLEETVTKMKVEAAQANSDNLQAKREAMRAIGGNLNHLRQAMARQREYDITTVKSITDLARVLLENGMLDDLSKYEMKRILGAVNGAVGKEDVGRYVDKVMDIMVDNQLRMGANAFGRLLAVKGSRVDARGVEVQGALDPEGVAIAKVVRKSTSLPKDEIENLIADAVDRMSSTDQAIADEATIEYAGLLIARQYVENIAESKAEEKSLRESLSNEHAARSAQAKESKQEIETLRQHAEAGHITKSEYEQRRHDIEEAERHEKDAFNQYRAATEEAIRQNKIERAEAYHELVEQVGDVMSESIERAKAWREAEKQRVGDIHHNANSDMEGRPTDEHHRDDRVQKLANNSAVRFLLAPLGTFDQMLRMFGKKNVRGEGYLWNRYMRGWVDATEKEYTGYRDALKQLDAKVSEVYGKKMKWGDLIKLDRKLPKATVRFMDGGEMKEHVLTQGNLLYIYMADKMTDGRMKLRKMGITESDIEDIKNFLDPHFIELADWMQEEFLVDKRNEYNEVHKRMFGASMAAIENYFPLKILANARMEDVDVSEETTDTALPATSTGSIIKRRRNNLALDVTGANAFSVILDHLQQMEKWAAFAEFNRDLNTLLSYKRFRNQVMNMSSAYGAGKTLWNNFRNVCSMAAGTYRPPIAALDKAAVNIAKGVTAAKVSFRVFTALKQFLSMPAYLSDSNPLYIAQNIANPVGAWRWSMKNLPLFEKRWSSRMSGDPRLMKTDMDWKAWRNNIVQFASRFGMSPNAFVDALTVSIGAHAMYQTKKRKYLRWGMSEADAESRAKQDATILFNQTQQSSEGAFLSTMQVDRSWLSVLFTVFRNSSMSYTRQQFDAIRNLAHRLVPGYGGLTEEFMAKQMRRDGIDPSKADKEARREYRRGIARDIARVAVFGYVLQLAWNMGAYLPYLILGDDDDEKKAMLDDAFTHAMFGSVEGLTGGDVLSAAGQMMATGEGDWSNLTKEMPIAGDLSNIYRKLGNDNVAAMNDVVNLLVQSGIGVNPQSVTDAVAAVIDWCGDDAESGRECALLIARILNCPQSQLDKIYLDELDLTGTEASRMTPAEIAERYARYKVMRGAPLTGWAYSDEKRDSVETKYRNKVRKIAKGKIEGRVATDSTRALLGDYDRIGKRKRELSAMRKAGDFEGYQRGMYELMQTENLIVRNRVGRYKRDIRELTELWLGTKDREELRELTRRMLDARERLLEDVAELEAQ